MEEWVSSIIWYSLDNLLSINILAFACIFSLCSCCISHFVVSTFQVPSFSYENFQVKSQREFEFTLDRLRDNGIAEHYIYTYNVVLCMSPLYTNHPSIMGIRLYVIVRTIWEQHLFDGEYWLFPGSSWISIESYPLYNWVLSSALAYYNGISSCCQV
jgi:hypothetical protein